MSTKTNRILNLNCEHRTTPGSNWTPLPPPTTGREEALSTGILVIIILGLAVAIGLLILLIGLYVINRCVILLLNLCVISRCVIQILDLCDINRCVILLLDLCIINTCVILLFNYCCTISFHFKFNTNILHAATCA